MSISMQIATVRYAGSPRPLCDGGGGQLITSGYRSPKLKDIARVQEPTHAAPLFRGWLTSPVSRHAVSLILYCLTHNTFPVTLTPSSPPPPQRLPPFRPQLPLPPGLRPRPSPALFLHCGCMPVPRDPRWTPKGACPSGLIRPAI